MSDLQSDFIFHSDKMSDFYQISKPDTEEKKGEEKKKEKKGEKKEEMSVPKLNLPSFVLNPFPKFENIVFSADHYTEV